MKKQTTILLLAGGAVFLLGFFLLMSVITTLNKENQLRQLVVAKQVDNKSEMDAMWKTIEQTAQVTQGQKDALNDIFTNYAKARGDTGGSLVKWIKEAVPNVSLETFNHLQAIIVSKRDGFARRQKELLDFSREHNTLLGNVYSGLVCRTFGRDAIPVTLVTSTRTEDSFGSGKDDNVTVFPR